jgi:hypothetical protein
MVALQSPSRFGSVCLSAFQDSQLLLLFFLVKKSSQKRQAERKTPSFGGLSIEQQSYCAA